MERAFVFEESLVDGIDLGHLKGSFHGEFAHDILVKALDTPAIVENFGNVLAAYQAAVENETRAGFKDVSESLAEKIRNELDPARDKVETGLKSGFRAMMEADEPEVVEAATMMLKLMQKHNLNTSLTTDAQTDAIRDFIADVDTNYKETLALTGMTILFEKLRRANQAVCDAQAERDSIDGDKVTKEMVAARKATDKAYRNLIVCVNAFALVQGVAGFAEFVSYTNAVIRRYKRVHLGQTVASPEAGPGDVVDGDEVVEVPGENNPGGDDNTDTGNDNNNGGNTTPGGSIPTNPQPGDGDDPDLYIYGF